MNKNLMLGFIAVVILAGGGFFLVSNRNKLAIQTVTEEETVNSGALVPDESSPTVADTIIEETASVKTFEIKASSFKFSLTEIRVKKGDRVKIVLNNTGGFHDWVIDEFDARTKQTQGPATETVEFTADKTGTFEYYCSVAQHRQNGMVGKLIVE
ncbi:hypothetical protein A2781_03525 [Candidatus Gottesmanbacteria bacterium RIFCSPHIGHO2_01_FULL_42_27]|nr:MAG: hypothetical protein A2781_03525 [Candidatus Gottesmanbacteria bacterium RIFCSPHIGHO2_01_FULL_42_27]OGG34081.1 MAG: hypothetical protein A3G68_05505 [Candidatus Gottesmanbacteria bacterium RIFCSPLOWO2_12_FULL_42_10]